MLSNVTEIDLKHCVQRNHTYWGHNGLTITTMRSITHGAWLLVVQLECTVQQVMLTHLRNGPHHCFGDHQNGNSSFCKCTNEEPTSIHKATLL